MRLVSFLLSLILFSTLLAAPAGATQTEVLQPRIINGDTVTDDAEYPWMVALLQSNEVDSFQAQFCGGSLIASNVVVTAAHCTEDSSAASIDVLVGIRDLDAATVDDRIGVDQIINHRSFNSNSLRNDISLLILETEVETTPAVLHSTVVADGQSATAIGWGATHPSGGAYPTLLQRGQMEIQGSCTEWGSNYDPVSMVCASGLSETVPPLPVDTCFGDSGGPLFLGDGTENIRIVGLTSWGSNPCANEGLPGVYTRVSTYTSWVSSSLTPTVSSFSPRSGAPGSTVRLSGSNLASVTHVSFGGVVAEVTTSNATSATVIVPAGAASGRLGAVSAYEDAGVGLSRSTFSVSYPSPRVSSVSPTEASPGDLVSISGRGFTGVTSVRFGSVASPSFEVVSDTRIEAEVPEGAQNGRVTVRNPSRSASGGNFRLAPLPGTPTITRLSSTSGAPGQVITITGTNLDTTTSVSFGGTLAEEFNAVSATQLLATIPTGASSGAVVVQNDVASATFSRSFSIRYPSPRVSRLSPSEAAVGESVVISGSGFFGVTNVRFGRTEASEFEVLSDRQIQVVVPEGAQNGRVTVRNPSRSASGGNFRLAPLPGTPTITRLSSTSGAPGQVITITGTNLDTTTSVSFGGTLAEEFNAVSATQLLATIPTGASSGAVVVQNDVASATFSRGFSVRYPRARVSSISPTSASAGDEVTVRGQNLQFTEEVRIGRLSIAEFDVVDEFTVRFEAPDASVRSRLTILGPGGSASSRQTLTVRQAI